MPEDIIEKAKKEFDERYDNIDWKKYLQIIYHLTKVLWLYMTGHQLPKN